MDHNVKLLDHQLTFLNDNHSRYLALCGGYGCGKTFSFCVKAINMAFINSGRIGAVLEPTIDMAKRILVPEMIELLETFNVEYTYAKADKIFRIKCANGETSTVHVLSGENYTRLVGLNLAWWGVDEVDVISNIDTCNDLFKTLMSRLRDKKANIRQGFFTSTPEGFHFLYDAFVKNAKEGRRLIKGRTEDNPHISNEFVQSLLEDYNEQQIKAYLEGEFVNLKSGTVYCNFDRNLNHTDINLKDHNDRVLHIGMDFNVGKCSAIVHIIIDGIPYAVDEITGILNTEAMITAIKNRYNDRPVHSIHIYPDASGKSNKTNSTQTDVVLLREAGFKVVVASKNPLVRDRVNTMNARFSNAKGERKYYVNTTICTNYTQTLEQQTWTKNGEPDKSNDLDHPNDAAGYFIYSQFPLKARAQLKVRR